FCLNREPIITIQKARPDALPSIERINYFHSVMLHLDEGFVEDKKHYDEALAKFRGELDSELKRRLLRTAAPTKLGFDVIRRSTGEMLLSKDRALSVELIHNLANSLPDIAFGAGDEELIPQARLEIE